EVRRLLCTNDYRPRKKTTQEEHENLNPAHRVPHEYELIPIGRTKPLAVPTLLFLLSRLSLMMFCPRTVHKRIQLRFVNFPTGSQDLLETPLFGRVRNG